AEPAGTGSRPRQTRRTREISDDRRQENVPAVSGEPGINKRKGNEGEVMKKSLFASILMVLIGGSFASSVIADDTLVRFKGAIGDIPVANVAGTPNPDGSFPDVIRNIVRGVNPAGQIWVISDFTADVKVDGRIRVDGRGLLLGGGNTIGTNGNASVLATVICEATPAFTQ